MSPPALKRLPHRRPGSLTLLMRSILDRLDRAMDRDGIAQLTAEGLARELSVPEATVRGDLMSLECRGIIVLSLNDVAEMSRLSQALKAEADRNRLRARRRSHSTADWSLRQRVYDLFPQLRAPVKRSKSYNIPAAFVSLLREYPHSHRRDHPANVEVITEAIYPGELTTALTMIAEQQSALRSVHLLYTRKALYVAVVRHSKH